MSEITWKDLTAKQQQTMIDLRDNRMMIDLRSAQSLQKRGLVLIKYSGYISQRPDVMLTDAGRALLPTDASADTAADKVALDIIHERNDETAAYEQRIADLERSNAELLASANEADTRAQKAQADAAEYRRNLENRHAQWLKAINERNEADDEKERLQNVLRDYVKVLEERDALKKRCYHLEEHQAGAELLARLQAAEAERDSLRAAVEYASKVNPDGLGPLDAITKWYEFKRLLKG